VGSITQTDFGYTGQRQEGYTGLMDYRARFYDGSLGRFLQPDSIVPSVGIPQSFNRYSYVLNSPTNLNDPTGHSPICTAAVIDGVCQHWAGLTGSNYAAGFKDMNEEQAQTKMKATKQIGSRDAGIKRNMYIKNIISNVQNLPLLPLQLQNPSTPPPGWYPQKMVWNPNNVDWIDIGINTAGIVGDLGFASIAAGDPFGPEIWLATEGLEIIGISRDANATSNGDFSGITYDGISSAVTTALKLKNAPDLIPVVGFFFNVRNIIQDLIGGYTPVPFINSLPIIK
jgi:RHS repeat-associated protein